MHAQFLNVPVEIAESSSNCEGDDKIGDAENIG
jgi:hypothetical protein